MAMRASAYSQREPAADAASAAITIRRRRRAWLGAEVWARRLGLALVRAQASVATLVSEG
jgi:hypothetical protein